MRRASTFVSLAAASLALLAAAPASAGSGASGGDRALRIEIHDHEHANLSLTVDASFVSGIVHTFSPAWMDCKVDRDDREMVELVRYLDEHGEGAQGMVTHHGDRVHGRRHANRLELQVDERDGDRAEITLPWGVADCILGRDVSVRKMWDDAVRDGDFEIRVVGEDGGTVHITLD
jgi:hypothetical protein